MKALSGIDLLGLQARLTLQRTAEGLPSVLDPVRRKYVRATPEEMVRQLWILYFLEVMQLNPKLIAVERSFTFNTMVRRFDLVIFGKTLEPVMLAEFKSPGTEINQSVFDQVARYNMELHVPLALISNGRTHYVFQMEKEHPGFHFLDTLPLPLL